MAESRDEAFYVGYQPKAPAALARFRAIVAVCLLLGVPAMMAAMAIAQRPLPPGSFEFGQTRTFEGVLYESPVPLLHMNVDFDTPLGKRGVNFLLVGAGKHGLPEVARGAHGRRVRFEGSLIEQEGQYMVEMNAPDTFEDLGQPDESERRKAKPSAVGAVNFVGELVDTKCFLGVMRPAEGKVHRACAVRCLEGGVPPGLLVRDIEGGVSVFMLTGSSGATLDVNPQWAGRLIRVEGNLDLYDETPVISVNNLTLAEFAR